MTRLISPLALLTVLFCPGCKKPAYTILDRSEKGPGGVLVMVRADVPADATKEQMEGWCGEINRSEGGGDSKSVIVEFLEEGGVMRQKGVCAGGKVMDPATSAGIDVTVR